jgi:outer membrane protein assembly factor BamD
MLRDSTKIRSLIVLLAVSLAGAVGVGANSQKKVKDKVTKVKSEPAQTSEDTSASAEPDKLLFERAENDIKRKKYIEGRLALQTLINTYPDSEYLAKAKLGLADSYYKEGGTSNLIQAIAEYKNFIVFFPFLDEAAYAQMQVGMSHYRMMQKSDRDPSQAQAAEDEFRTFLLKYPQSSLVPGAEQHLREVQELLADGDFNVARFYYIKQDYRASAARLMEVTERYPLYSQSDEALAMLGDVYLRAKQFSRNEDDKNHWADLAGECYARIVRDYPLSKLVPEAKVQLKSMGMTIPAADPQALARMQVDQEYEEHHHPDFLLKIPMGIISSHPDLYTAAHSGKPNLSPPDDSFSATEVLRRGASGPSFSVEALGVQTGGGSAGGGSESVETESSNSSANTQATNTGNQVSDAPAAGDSKTSPSTLSTIPADPEASSVTTENSATRSASSEPAPTSPASVAGPSQEQTSAPQTAQSDTDPKSVAGGGRVSSKNDSKDESSSKKKKGFRKFIPW